MNVENEGLVGLNSKGEFVHFRISKNFKREGLLQNQGEWPVVKSSWNSPGEWNKEKIESFQDVSSTSAGNWKEVMMFENEPNGKERMAAKGHCKIVDEVVHYDRSWDAVLRAIVRNWSI